MDIISYFNQPFFKLLLCGENCYMLYTVLRSSTKLGAMSLKKNSPPLKKVHFIQRLDKKAADRKSPVLTCNIK